MTLQAAAYVGWACRAARCNAREQRKVQRRLQTAKLRYPAALKAVVTHPRRLKRQQVLTLSR